MNDDRQSTEDVLRRAFLNAYPNPERIGCPGTATLRALVEGRGSDTDELTEHMSQCSPCTREFLELQKAVRKRRNRHVAVVTSLGAVAAAILIWLLLPKRDVGPHKHVPVSAPLIATLDYHEGTARGAHTQGQLQTVPLRTNELRILLQQGTDIGPYRVAFQSPVHVGQDLAVFSANAETRSDGLVSLSTKVDLESLAPGEYVLVWRHAGSEGYGTVVISR